VQKAERMEKVGQNARHHLGNISYSARCTLSALCPAGSNFLRTTIAADAQ